MSISAANSMEAMFRHIKLVLAVFSISVVTIIAGCGGGGGGGGAGGATPISATATTTAQNLTVGTAMASFSPLTASGGTLPYTYSYTGTLPAGLSFSASTGAVTGTPTVPYATANLVFSVKDANNVVASTTSTVSFTVAAITYTISGSVTGAASFVTMTLSGAASAVTATSGGNYSFSGLSNGSYIVTPSLTGSVFAPQSQGITLSNSVTLPAFTATSGTGYAISGNVTLANGGPAAGVSMTLSGANTGETITDSNGNYSFAGLLNGSYTVTPGLAGYALFPASSPAVISGAPLTAINFNVANYLMTLTHNPSGDFDLSTFAYISTGSFPNATPASTLTIPATAPTSGANAGCGGSLNGEPSSAPYDLWYDKTNHLLMLAFWVSTTSETVCVYKTDMATGTLSFVQAKTLSGSYDPGWVDQINHAFIFGNSGTVYSYNSDGTINTSTPLSFTGIGNIPSTYGLIDIDVVNHWGWYGTNSGGVKTIYGVCPLTYSASSGYTMGSCSSFSSPVAVPSYRPGIDATNGLYFTISQVPNACTSTQTVASVYPYDISTGVIDSTPVTSDVGVCAQNLGTPNASGPNMGAVDLMDQIFFTWTNSSGVTVNPITYTYTSGTFAFSSFPASATDSNTTIGTSGDPVNHLIFAVTVDGSGNVNGIDAVPYTGSGLGTPVSSPITPTNTTPTTNGPALFEFIY